MPEEMREVMALLERELKTLKRLDPFDRGSTPSKLKLQPSCTLCECAGQTSQQLTECSMRHAVQL
jgi:hypothetical protein